MKKGNVLEIKDLSVDFMTVRGIVYAVQGVDLEVKQGEIHGIVGESGCGKSVTSKSVIRLHNEETTRYAGDIYIRDDSGEKDVLAMSRKQIRDFRGSTAAMIFQDPMTSLDPIMKAGEQGGRKYPQRLRFNSLSCIHYSYAVANLSHNTKVVSDEYYRRSAFLLELFYKL